MSLITNTWRIGASLLLPSRCVLCDTELDETAAVQLCESCTTELAGDTAVACPRCGMSLPEQATSNCPHCRRRRFRFERAFRCGEYSGPLRDAVLRAKTLAGEPVAAALGELLARSTQRQLKDGFHDLSPADNFDLVTCVPSYWFRRLRRGTNSAAVIAQVVASRLRIPAALDMLVCRRNIEKQSELSLDQRRKNVRQAFRTSWGYQLQGARILLVDDVMTSGATAHEIAKVLRRAGAERVAVAVAARALGPDW
jgi:ComF family protein